MTRRGDVIQVRVSEEEKLRIGMAAQRAGQSVSEWLRWAGVQFANVAEAQERDLLAQADSPARHAEVHRVLAKAAEWKDHSLDPAEPPQFRCPRRCGFMALSARAHCPRHGRLVVPV